MRKIILAVSAVIFWAFISQVNGYIDAPVTQDDIELFGSLEKFEQATWELKWKLNSLYFGVYLIFVLAVWFIGGYLGKLLNRGK